MLPLLLEHPEPLRIALIGSTPETLRAVGGQDRGGTGTGSCSVRDGYAGLPTPAELRGELRAAACSSRSSVWVRRSRTTTPWPLRAPGVLVATCGGWLDQFAGDTYYPAWAYPLRLNWLVRLAREPKRLWRRYTVDAIRAVRARAAVDPSTSRSRAGVRWPRRSRGRRRRSPDASAA